MPNTLDVERSPKVGLDCEKLELIAGGHTAFQLLWAGIDLGLFNLLSARPGLTEEQVRRELKIEKAPARILVVGLLSLGVIEREGESLRNAKLTEDNLVEGKPGSLAGVFELQAKVIYPALADFTDSLRENRNVGLRHFPGPGNTLYQHLTAHPHLEKVFQKALSALTQKTNVPLLKLYDFGAFKHILDIGGGDGTNASHLVKKFPSLQVTVFDFPSVCDIAKAKLSAQGLDEKVKTHAGNFLTDPFPTGMDAVMFNHISPIWSEERNVELFKKSYAALPKGGAVLIYNMMMRDDDMGPLTPAFGSTYFLTLATGEGRLYSWKEYESCLKQAGFDDIERVEGLPLHHGLLVGRKS